MERDSKLIEVKDLKTYYYSPSGVVKAVDGIDLDILPGETLGIVGESGCGKSVTSLSIMGLIESPPGKIAGGEILYNGKDLVKLSPAELRKIRGSEISMIFQEPMTSLNPVYTVGYQISEAIRYHKDLSSREVKRESVEMLKKVGIPIPEQRVNEYPHQLSGGMRQRVMIAMALACRPRLLIADEPTTALDVTVQAQILDLLKGLQEQMGMSILMITHDLGVIAELSDRVAVMYAGKIVEFTDVKRLFADPRHPYTLGLLKSVPRTDLDVERLEAIPGNVPSPRSLPKGCRFNTRCQIADSSCFQEEPGLVSIGPGHRVRCWHVDRLKS
jgi:peptide/nickel transport system ATP-binding protein/oligopeptide transport system ATP-binding protein